MIAVWIIGGLFLLLGFVGCYYACRIEHDEREGKKGGSSSESQ